MLNSMKKIFAENQEIILVTGILTATSIQMHQALKIKNPLTRSFAFCGALYGGYQMLSVLSEAQQMKIEKQRLKDLEEIELLAEPQDSAK